MKTSTAFQNNNKYIPPNRQSFTTKKKELKKEFSLESQASAFPSLSRNDNDKINKPLLSFANATKTKQTEEVVTAVVSDVLPGWIHIRNNNGKLECKAGKPTTRYPCSDDHIEVKLSNAMINNRLAKAQYERDNDVNRLGDLSQYYGAKTLLELFADEEEAMQNTTDNDNLSSSEYSDYEDSNNIFGNKFENSNQI
uniref:Uncharacterized protein n=1 Tax=viral metagenome TaxID=1070528 RepID=A0A6C0IIA8_9ZZZZ